MKITEMLKKAYVVGDLAATTKREVLLELSRQALQEHSGYDSEKVVEILLEREKLGSTGIGDGIAIPHGKLPFVDEMIVAFGRSVRGMDFNAVDGKPVHMLFMLLAPENAAGQHLKVLAKLSRMLKDAAFRKRLMEAKTTDDLYALIADKDDAC